jgi:hypothetical protein
MFVQSRGKSIVYQGQMLVLSDHFPLLGATRLRFAFEACQGAWRQGVALRPIGDSQIVINGERLEHAICWYDTSPPSFEFEVTGGRDSIVVYNVWDTGEGVIHAKHNGAAMIVDELATGRRYRCNDGYPDDDFDDVVFSIERL